jgi:hypothetical protein
MSDDNISYTSHDSDEFDIIQIFLDYHTDNIISLYYEFKQRFSYTPFFLANLKSTDLTDFFIELLYYKDTFKYKKLPLLNFFLKEYSNELDISFNITEKLLTSCKYKLDYDSWTRFCYTKSKLNELF